MASGTVCIDGSILEGGGQILRNAAALSCLLHQPITVNNIRAGRNNPGLRPQHKSGLDLIREICGGKLIGGNVSSVEITMVPGFIKAGSYVADTKTAGSANPRVPLRWPEVRREMDEDAKYEFAKNRSICLLIQASLPCLFYANGPAELLLKGGTNADMAPQIDYLTWVFRPMVERFGVKFECDIKRRGYFPKGGGEVCVRAEPIKSIQAVDLTDVGQVIRISGRAFTAGVIPIKVSHQMARTAQDTLKRVYRDIPIQMEAVKEREQDAFGNGTGLIVMAETSTGCLLAGSALGKRGIPAEKVGQDAAEMLLRNLQEGGCVDEYLQDQLIILMALAKGTSRVRCGTVTLHTKTAIHIAQELTEAKFEIKPVGENQNIIECHGIGLENKQI